jgi:hypothetical protein
MTTVKVVREGGRGWHNISSASYDPSKHTLYDQEKPKAKLEKRPRK